MNNNESEVKIEWVDEIDVDSNGEDFVMMSSSADDRFYISPVYVSGENPSYFILNDYTGKTQKSCDSVAQCKKHAHKIVNAKVWTQDELIERAARELYLNRDGKFAAKIIANAQKRFGVDITAIELPAEVKAQIDAFRASCKGS